jgi:hypothetical protein
VDDDFNGYIDDVVGWDFVGHDALAVPERSDEATGTFLAGIAAADSDNQAGIAGVSWGARVMPLRVLEVVTRDGRTVVEGNLDHATQALCYAANSGADVALLAFGHTDPAAFANSEAYTRLVDAIEYANRRGLVLVAPVSNCGGIDPRRGDAEQGCRQQVNPYVSVPAALPHVVAVGAVDRTGLRAATSETGAHLDLLAPGAAIRSTVPGGATRHSVSAAFADLAAAHVAGGVTLVKSVNPDLEPDDLECVLRRSANRDAGGPWEPDGCGARNDEYGGGRADFEAGVKRHVEHRLQVAPSELYAMVDGNGSTEVCWRLVNNYTCDCTWSVSADGQTWLSVASQSRGRGVPSQANVCANLDDLRRARGGILEFGRYSGAVVAASRQSRGSQSIPVTIEYMPKVHAIYVPLAQH